MMVHGAVITFGILFFVAISAASKLHFKSGHFPPAMRLVSVLSLAGIANLVLAFGNMRGLPIAALLAMLAAIILFFLALQTSRGEGLRVAFDQTAVSERVIGDGPYRFIRHPFYASYILFWIGCAAYTANLVGYVVLLALAVSYYAAARGEEEALLCSDLACDYAAYRRQAGFLWPKF